MADAPNGVETPFRDELRRCVAVPSASPKAKRLSKGAMG